MCAGRQIVINWNGAAIGGVTVSAPYSGLATYFSTYTLLTVSYLDVITIKWTTGPHGLNQVSSRKS